jgi:cob(I)alamin adenosyltransferase
MFHVGPDEVLGLEVLMDQCQEQLEPLNSFVLPGGGRVSGFLHLARTVCRRAERSLVALGGEAPVGEHARQYLNRLSDLLFVAGRVLNRHAGRGDQQWRHERKR